MSDPSARERYLVDVGVPVRHRPRYYRHVALGGLALHRHLLLCPAEGQALWSSWPSPDSASHAKLGALAAGSDGERPAGRR
jgi:hypothetical protein